MARVLFVDDEPRVLEGIELALFEHLDGWEMRFATGGAAALALMEAEEFDVLVTDMKMPGMDGAELLERVSLARPEIARVVLSGHAELEAALRALPVAHQFLSKPVSGRVLAAALDRARRLHQLVSPPPKSALDKQALALPSRPSTYVGLTAELMSGATDLEHAAWIVEKDVAIASRLLHVCNAPFFGHPGEVRNVSTALKLLSPSLVCLLVLGFEAHHALPGVDHRVVERVRKQGFLAMAVCMQLTGRPGSDAHIAALLHEIGALAAAQNAGEVPAEALDAEHADLGAFLLGRWGMSYQVIEAVEHHHRPARGLDEFGIVGMVHVAAAVAEALVHGTEPQFDAAYLATHDQARNVAGWLREGERVQRGLAGSGL